MIYKIESGRIELELEDIQMEDSEYMPYGKDKRMLGMFSYKEYFSARERIIISKPLSIQ